MAWDMVINPLSKRMIRKGSVLHIKLMKRGIMDENGGIEQKPVESETENVVKIMNNQRVIKYRIKKM